MDVRRFEHLLAEAGRALAAGDAEGAVTLYDAGLALWRGEALADFVYEPWARAEADRLEELRLVAREERMSGDSRRLRKASWPWPRY